MAVNIYSEYLSLKINEKSLIIINNFIPTVLLNKNKEEITLYFTNDLKMNIDKIYNTTNYNKIFVNKYLIKNKYDFLQFFNTINNTLLYKFINFYYIIYNNFNNTLHNKKYNDYLINWDCSYNNRLIESYELSYIHLDYNKNSNINDINYNFYKILNISLKVWDDFYLIYLNRCVKCDLSDNSIYNNIILETINDNKFLINNNKSFDYGLFINEYDENKILINKNKSINKINILTNNENNGEEQYILIFQYIEVTNDDVFEFNFDFLNTYNNYPDTLFKNNNEELIYILNENNDINIIGWYKSTDYSIDKNNINKIFYNDKIIITENKNLYIYILFEYN